MYVLSTSIKAQRVKVEKIHNYICMYYKVPENSKPADGAS